MKTKLKKFVSLCLAGTLLLFAAGCTDKKSDVSPDGAVTKIKIFRPGFKIGNATNIVAEMEKRTNTKLDFLEAASNEGSQKSALIITSGEEVDWVNVSGNQPYKQWGKDGLLNDLRPYLEKYKDQLPTLNKLAFADVYKPLRGESNEIYAIPAINYTQNAGIRMNKSWLEETGLKKPETLEEIHQVLKAFKLKKANVDGATPLIADGMFSFNWSFLAFGGMMSSDGIPRYYEENGNFLPYDISDMHKETLKYIRTLYQEGLINKDWPVIGQTSQSYDQFVAGKAGMRYSSQGIDERMYETQKTTTEWIDAPKGPSGIQSYGGEAPYWMLNTIPSSIKDSTQILGILKFMEWMHSKDARMLCNYGIEGRHYEINENGEIDSSKYRANMDEDFARVNGGNCPFGWGFVSPYPGVLNLEKYDKVEDALKNIELFNAKPKEPVDENYQQWVKHCEKFATMYPYAVYSIDDLTFASQQTIEFRTQFYINAITNESFNIDAEWGKFTEQYMNEHNGKKCLDIFSNYVKKNN